MFVCQDTYHVFDSAGTFNVATTSLEHGAGSHRTQAAMIRHVCFDELIGNKFNERGNSDAVQARRMGKDVRRVVCGSRQLREVVEERKARFAKEKKVE